MRIAIKNPAPRGKNLEKWGDFHFGKALESSLRRCGVEVDQHFWPEWDHCGEDIALWLRGKRRCKALPGIVNAVWILSHPATVTELELKGFDLVFSASERLAEELEERSISGVVLMRQCVDHRRFRANATVRDAHRRGLLFVAGSRGVNRPILQWALESGLRPTVVGGGWDRVGRGHLVTSDHVPNAQLPLLYSSAKYGMNDHWSDMAHFGMINNRVFDTLASGLPLISDGFPELRRVTGDSIWVVDGPKSFREAYWDIRLDYSAARRRTLAWWEHHGPKHTFDARAKQILRHLEGASKTELNLRSAPEHTLASTRILELFSRIRSPDASSSRITHSLLHIGPTNATSGVLSAVPWLSRIGAGYGVGPWEARLDDDLKDLGDRTFDVIFIENGPTGPGSGRLLDARHDLVKHLRLGAFAAANDPSHLRDLADDPRMAVVSTSPLVLRRTIDRLDCFFSPASSATEQ